MNNPDWRAYERFMVRQQLEAGCDGIFFDNPTVHPQGLLLPLLHGADSPSSSGRRVAAGRGPQPVDTLREFADKHPAAFMRFRSTIARDFLADMRDYARSLKHTRAHHRQQQSELRRRPLLPMPQLRLQHLRAEPGGRFRGGGGHVQPAAHAGGRAGRRIRADLQAASGHQPREAGGRRHAWPRGIITRRPISCGWRWLKRRPIMRRISRGRPGRRRNGQRMIAAHPATGGFAPAARRACSTTPGRAVMWFCSCRSATGWSPANAGLPASPPSWQRANVQFEVVCEDDLRPDSGPRVLTGKAPAGSSRGIPAGLRGTKVLLAASSVRFPRQRTQTAGDIYPRGRLSHHGGESGLAPARAGGDCRTLYPGGGGGHGPGGRSGPAAPDDCSPAESQRAAALLFRGPGNSGDRPAGGGAGSSEEGTFGPRLDGGRRRHVRRAAVFRHGQRPGDSRANHAATA